MSSDESASTNISSVSNRSKIKAKSHRPEKWEIDLVGSFLLGLYHRSFITSKTDWCAKKADLRNEFDKFLNEDQRQKLKKLNGTDNIGTLLYRCGFLINTTRGSPLYKIKTKSLFDFRNNKLKELDNQRIKSDLFTHTIIDGNIFDDIQKSNNEEIDENEPKQALEYQGSTMQRRVAGFFPNNMCCFICQEDFNTMELFEEHIQMHGDDTDFEYLNKLDKFNSPFFNLSYRLCKNSHNFCFEIESALENLIIEKIIIVQTRSFFYVHNMRVPYKFPENGTDRFFVDSHLFTKHLEQPIVILCHLANSKETLFIEQHHFMRSEDFPKVSLYINPNRLPSKKLFQQKFQLAQYFPPKEIQDALKDDFYHQKLMRTSNEFRDYIRNEKKLQPQTIGASLNILLQIEDMDTIQQYLNLKQKNITLRKYGDEYSFQLKPRQRVFLENILTPYDEVVITMRTDILTSNEKLMQLMLQNTHDIHHTSKNTYVGLIQAINTGRVSFKCDKKININGSYVVAFRPSRINFRHQYRALELLPINIEFLKKFLFPAKIIPLTLPSISIELYNKNLNDEQLQAVRNIAQGPRNDATYIIFGPPGTGKTSTLVEGILQLLRKPETKILVTASSNSACDEIALRLCKFLPHLDIPRCLVRIYSRACEVRTESIAEILLENSNMYNGQFYPDVEILHNYRIVVCTLAVVAKLATGKFGRQTNGDGVYTHLLIDEVAATMEAEALMAITTILTRKSSLVISGDHKQLGPVLKSMRAKELGLDSSLMDRLIARDCYRVDVDTGDYDRTIQTRLIKNYRSHPAIVNLYSGLYYNHSLESCAKQENTSLGESWHNIRNKEYPIIFHAIYEPSKSDRQSYSLFNFTEALVVMDYVKNLMYFGINGKPVKESDIGIISPYKKQYQYIKEELNLRKWFGIETGSVETFQGQEKAIIIVSFVRSGTDNLGFLDNPRRLNVTLSRPKSILILIGNPKTLSLNKDFEYVIKECKRNNTFVGSNGSSNSDPKQILSETNIKTNEIKQANQTVRGGNGGSGARSKDNNKPLLDAVDLVTDNSGNKTNQDKKSKKSRERRRGARESRKRNKNRRNQNDSNNKQTDQNQRDDDSEDDDDFDSQSQASSINISKNSNAKESGNRNSSNDLAARNGKNSKENGSGKSLKTTKENTNPNGTKLDSIFKDLPNIPKTTSTTPTIFTNDQILLLQQQQRQYVQTFEQNARFYQNCNGFNPYLNMQTTNSVCRPLAPTAPIYSPYTNQPQQNLHTHQFYPYHMNTNYPGFHNNVLLSNNYSHNTIAQQKNINIPKLGQEKESANTLTKALTNAANCPAKKSVNSTKTNVIKSNVENSSKTAAKDQPNHQYQITNASKETDYTLTNSKLSAATCSINDKLGKQKSVLYYGSNEEAVTDKNTSSSVKLIKTNFNTFDTPSGPMITTKDRQSLANTHDSCEFITMGLRNEIPSSSVRIFSKLTETKHAKLEDKEQLIETLKDEKSINSTGAKPKKVTKPSDALADTSGANNLAAAKPELKPSPLAKNISTENIKLVTNKPLNTLISASGEHNSATKKTHVHTVSSSTHNNELHEKVSPEQNSLKTTSHKDTEKSSVPNRVYKSGVEIPSSSHATTTARDAAVINKTSVTPSANIKSFSSNDKPSATTVHNNLTSTSSKSSMFNTHQAGSNDKPSATTVRNSLTERDASSTLAATNRSSSLLTSSTSSKSSMFNTHQAGNKVLLSSGSSSYRTTSSSPSSTNISHNSGNLHSSSSYTANIQYSPNYSQRHFTPIYEERGRTVSAFNKRNTSKKEEKSCVVC